MLIRPFPWVSVLVTLALAGPAPATALRQPKPAPALRDLGAIVRFDLYQGYFIVAHGSAGPLKDLNFFLDTGTSVAVLDSRIARKLNLHGEEPASIVILGGRDQGEYANLPSLEFGPLQCSNLQVITADLSFFQKAIPVRIDAIVGLDVLGQSPFVIDYSARAIRFGPPPALRVSVPLRLDRGLAVLDAQIDSTPVHLLFDTGASSLIVFSKAVPQGPAGKGDSALAAEAIGSFESKQVWLSSLRLGRKRFRQKPALMASNPKPSQLDFDGLMSPTALGISQVAVDLQQGVLAFGR